MTDSHLYTAKLTNWLQAWSQGHLRTGRLDVKSTEGMRWSLYFHLGHIVGEAGGVHPARRWYRQLSQHCPQLSIDAANVPTGKASRYEDYESLAELLRQREILRQQMVGFIQGSIAEVLFDIVQHQEILRSSAKAQLSYNFIPEDKLYSSPLVYIKADQAWQQAQQAWNNWQEAGLEAYSPNMAPAIWKPEALQRQSSPPSYRSLIALMDGKHTLRDLALKLKQETLLLTQLLVPYIRQGLIKLIAVADLNHVSEQVTANKSQPATERLQWQTAQKQTLPPLVAYIDDSPRDSEIMGQILTKAGYRYINLQESVLALPMLLEHKPRLIFLDLVMPIANGYEICAQIRRTSVLKDTPVIIFTGNDGIVDRVRAKMVRSTEFLAKPIEPKKVLAVVKKYLSVPNSMGQGLRNSQNARL
jgi:CheY-like chemotaxis protein